MTSAGHRTRRVRPKLVQWALIGAAVGGLVGVGDARAATFVASVETRSCQSGIVWRVGYRLYFASPGSAVADRSRVMEILGEAQTFVDRFGLASACALRIVVDAFDMGSVRWTAGPGRVPLDDGRFRAQGGYDSTFYRYPASGGESFAGLSGVSGRFSWSLFPVGVDGCPLGAGLSCTDWPMLMFHEFMHQVVAFYRPSRGWPSGGVHGGAAHGYTVRPLLSEQYFGAMLQGGVREQGALRGMVASEYVVQGTPMRLGPVAGRECVVPLLVSRTVAGARRAVARAGCRLGDVAGRGRYVLRQRPLPGAGLRAGTRVSVWLGERGG